MKTIISLLVLTLLLSSFTFAQFVEKPVEKKKEKKTETVTPVDTTEEENPTLDNPPVNNNSSVNLYKLKNKQNQSSDNQSKDYSKKNAEFWYPVPQFQVFMEYVSLKNPSLKVTGGDFYISARQKQDPLDKSTTNSKTWGLFAKGGRFKVDITNKDKTSTNINVEQIGGGISLAVTRNRPDFNAWVINLGILQEVEKGNSGLYEWQQVNLDLIVDGWIDLSRNQNTFFSRSNLGYFYRKPLSFRRSALYDGQTAPAEIWDKEGWGFEYQQTMLMIYLGGSTGLHLGGGFGHTHYCAKTQDWYSVLGFAEIFWNKIKIFQFVGGVNMKSNDNTKNGSNVMFKLNFDGLQFLRSVNIL